MIPEGSPEKILAKTVASAVHQEHFKDAALAISDFFKLGLKIDSDNPAKTIPPIQYYVHDLINTDAKEEAAQILWTPNQFTPEPQFTRDLWTLFEQSNMGLIMGAASCSKSFAMGVNLFLEWIRDPEWTTIRVIGPSEDHLEKNLFSHLVSLHQRSKLPMPGEVGELFIGLNRRDQLSSIKGVVIPIGKVKKAGRIQGEKRKPRIEPHHLFGSLSRLFIFIDEIENVPGGLWSDIDNILSNVQDEGAVSGFKIFGAYNPTNQSDEVAKRAEPPFGWSNFDLDSHFRWKSIRGWDVLRLDGEKSENVVQAKLVFPGLQTRGGLEAIARNGGGRSSAGYYSMGRGAYPPSGVELTVIPPGMLAKWRGEYVWYDNPSPCGACDLALEGGAAASFTLGRFGKVVGVKYPPSLEFPKGNTVMFKDSRGEQIVRNGLQIDQQFSLPKGDTVVMKTQLIDLCRKSGIRPEHFACDRTGHGQGVADLMKHEWSSAIHAINYSEGSTDTRIMVEDSKTCKEQYYRICTEIWFALRAYGEFGYLLLHPQMDMSKITQQLTQRKFRIGEKTRVEAKSDYISRGFASPDEADSLTLIVHAVRIGAGWVLSMNGEGLQEGLDMSDEWYDGHHYPGGVRIDPSNMTDYLDSNP